MDFSNHTELMTVMADHGISFLPPDWHIPEFAKCCSGLRTYLSENKTTQGRVPLLGNNFFDIEPRYRCDLLSFDIPGIANQLAMAIGYALLYYPYTAKAEDTYFPTIADVNFWYHMDFGFRLASSGWDRLSLLLDMAYELDLKEKCSLRRVLGKMSAQYPEIVKITHFKSLKSFRDGKFQELEGGAGRGARHETTHLLSPRTRFFAEFLDTTFSGEPIAEQRRETQIEMLMAHHWHLLRGIQDTLELVSYRWPHNPA